MNYDFQFSQESIQILKLSIPHLFAQLLVTTYNTYIILYLEKDLFISTILITIIVSLQNILQLIFRVPLSQLSQIFGRKPLILAGHICYLLSILVIVISSNIWILLASSSMLAVGMSSYVPAIFAYVGDVADNNFGELLGRVFSMGDLGIVLGAYISYFTLGVLSMNFYWLFGVMTVLQLFATCLALIIIPEVIDENDRIEFGMSVKLMRQSLVDSFRSLHELSSDYQYRALFFYQFIFAVLEFLFITFFAVLIVNKGFSKGDVGKIIFIGTLCLLWFKPLLGKQSDRFGYRALKSRILFLNSIVFIFIIHLNSIFLLIMAYIAVISGIYTSYQAFAGDVSKLTPPSERGVAMGALGFFMSLGRGISTLLVGAIWKFLGIEMIFLLFAVWIFLLSLISWVTDRWNV
ncbi:MAG: MFS transporter [Candidatus Kariarchaeaceae archaeon]